MCVRLCSFLPILFPFPFVQFIQFVFSSASSCPVRSVHERASNWHSGVHQCGPSVCVHLLLLFVFMCKCQCVLCRAFGILYCALLCIWKLRARSVLLIELSSSSQQALSVFQVLEKHASGSNR